MRKGIIGLMAVMLACSCGNKGSESIKSSTKVKTEIVASTQAADGQSYVGIVEESEATAVSFTSMGVVKRMLVSEGQMVQRGQLLAEIDATSSGNSVEAAKALTSQAEDMVRQAENTYAQAKDAHERLKLLHDNGSLPEIKWIEVETQLRQAETALNTAHSSVRSAAATERIARKNLSDTRLTAPVSGVIGKKMVGTGETALPSQAVVTILNINSVKVKVSIPETEMSTIHSDSRSLIAVDAVDKQVTGGRIEKGVQADALTHTYDIRINVPNADHKLLPGMVANVRFDTSSGTGNPLLPISCVQKKADGSLFVWTVGEDGCAHRNTVRTGPTFGNRISVTQGIRTGQRVITEGYQKLSEGTKVEY